MNGDPTMASATASFDGLNEKLKAAIPTDARSVLEFGCANGHLGAACKAGSPALRWTGVDVSAAAVAEAATRLDATIQMNLDEPDAGQLGSDHDVVVFGDVLEHLRDPSRCLRAAHAASSPDARLVCCIPNMAHVSVIERMLAGDLSYDTNGLLDETHLRFLTPASTFKLLADAGWVPNLRDRYLVGHGNPEFLQLLVAAAKQLGIPEQTALGHLVSYQLIIDCIKMPLPAAGDTAPFSVVVPVTNRQQFELNVRRSPGLAEVQAQIIPVEGAANPAEAFAMGRAQAQSPWIIFCHQDIYFPSGTGHALAALFGAIPADEAPGTLIGFAGIGQLPGATLGPAGLVVDRTLRFDFPNQPPQSRWTNWPSRCAPTRFMSSIRRLVGIFGRPICAWPPGTGARAARASYAFRCSTTPTTTASCRRRFMPRPRCCETSTDSCRKSRPCAAQSAKTRLPSFLGPPTPSDSTYVGVAAAVHRRHPKVRQVFAVI